MSYKVQLFPGILFNKFRKVLLFLITNKQYALKHYNNAYDQYINTIKISYFDTNKYIF